MARGGTARESGEGRALAGAGGPGKNKAVAPPLELTLPATSRAFWSSSSLRLLIASRRGGARGRAGPGEADDEDEHVERRL